MLIWAAFFRITSISKENINSSSIAKDTMSFIIFFMSWYIFFLHHCDNNKHRTKTTKHRRINWHLTFLCFGNASITSLLSSYSIYVILPLSFCRIKSVMLLKIERYHSPPAYKNKLRFDEYSWSQIGPTHTNSWCDGKKYKSIKVNYNFSFTC